MSLPALLVALSLAQPGPMPLPEPIDGAVPDYDGSVSADASIFELDASIITPDASVNRPDGSIDLPDASIGPPDASVGSPDAAVPPLAGTPRPRPAALALGAGAFVAAWASPLRDEAFGSERGRGADLWSNGWLADGGLGSPWGQLLCPAAKGERYSEPRLAWTGAEFVYLWRVEQLGAGGHSLRMVRVTPAGAAGTCDELVAHDGVERSALNLAAVGDKVLAVWETPTELRGHFLGQPSSFLLHAKDASLPAHRPSLTALDTGFEVVWLEGTTLEARSIAPTGGIGTSTTPLGISAKHATVTGAATATAVYVEVDASGGTTASALLAMDLGSFGLPSTLRSYTTDAPPLAARAGSFLFAAHTPYAGAPAAEVVQRGVMAPTPVPNGGQPQAMASGEQRAGLLVQEGETWRVYALPALANGNGPTLQPLAPTRPGDWQQVPTTAWVAPDGWVVTWFDGRSRAASGAVIGADGSFRGLATAADAGVPRMVSATAEGLAGVALFAENTTRLYALAAAALPAVTATSRLEVTGEQPATALGAHLAAAWNPALGTFWWKTASAPSLSQYPQGTLGRCGAFAGGRLWVPTLGERGSGVLGLLSLEDSATNSSAQPTSHALVPNVGAGGTPCLAANGTRGLVAWVDGTQNLVLARVDLSSTSPTAELLPAPGGAMKRRDPVVAAIAGGWAVAWELELAVRSQVQSVTVGLDGAVSAPTTWSNTIDARSPALASGPTGEALLAFHQFHPELGAALVKHRVLPGLSLPDGGVPDAGTSPGDAGQGGDDAGVAPGDGGAGGGGGGDSLNEPVEFSSCGCAADGASLLAALALATLRRRRR